LIIRPAIVCHGEFCAAHTFPVLADDLDFATIATTTAPARWA